MAVKEPTPTRRPKAPEAAEKARFKEEKPSPFSIEGIRRGAVASNIVKVFLVASGLIMAGGFIVSSLNPAPELADRNGARRAQSNNAIAQVGDRSISGAELDNVYGQQQQQMIQFGMAPTAANYFDGRKNALQSLTGNAALVQAAQKSGITVTDAEVDAKINELVSEQLKPQAGQTEAAFRRAVEAKFGSMDKARAEMVPNYDRDRVRDFLLVDKFQKGFEAQNKVTEDDYKRSVTKLKLWKIAVQPPLPAPNAKTPTDPKAQEMAAKVKADQIFNKLKAAPTLANFQTVAKAQSDDAASKAKGGDIGWKLPGEIGAEVGDALAKAPGQLVGPIADPSGAQDIFFIENRVTKLPADYAKNQKKLLADFEKTQDSQAWQTRQGEITKAVTPQISDPALAAYSTQTAADFYSKAPEEQKKARAGAIEQYKTALAGATGLEAAAINYQMAQLYGAQGDKAAQLAALKAAVAAQENDPNLRLEYARALREGGQPKLAVEELKAISKRLDEVPSQPTMFGNPDDNTRRQIAAEFGLLKEPALAAAESAKVKPAQPGAMGGLPPGVQIMPGG